MVQHQPDHASWDRAAAAHWRGVPEDERDVWRALVRERLPAMVRVAPKLLEGLAMGWAYDPKMVVGPPLPRKPRDPGSKAQRVGELLEV